MRPFSVDLRDLLVAAGIGVFAAQSGWAIGIGKELASPDTFVTIYDTGGPAPMPHFSEEYPTAQIRVRGAVNGYEAAYDKARAARAAVKGQGPLLLGGTHYAGLWIVTEPGLIGYDDSNRPLFTFNVRAVRGEAFEAA